MYICVYGGNDIRWFVKNYIFCYLLTGCPNWSVVRFELEVNIVCNFFLSYTTFSVLNQNLKILKIMASAYLHNYDEFKLSSLNIFGFMEQ